MLRDENSVPNGSWLTCIDHNQGTEKGEEAVFRPLSGFWSCLIFRASLQPALRSGGRWVAGQEVGLDGGPDGKLQLEVGRDQPSGTVQSFQRDDPGQGWVLVLQSAVIQLLLNAVPEGVIRSMK